MQKILETSDIYSSPLSIIEETFGDGSKLYDVEFHGDRGLTISCTSEKQARDVYQKLLEVANISLW